MKTNNQTLAEKIESLKTENSIKLERKINELSIQEKLLELTGLDFMVLIHSEKSTSIWIENDQYNNNSKFDRYKINEYYKSICNLFKPINQVLTFASSAAIETFAPVKIYFDNNFNETCFHHTQTAQIEFSFEDGIKVSFKFPVYNGFDSEVLSTMYEELKPYNTSYTGKMGKQLYYIGMPFGKVRMYGNDYYTYCINADQYNDFMNVVFYGKTLNHETIN